MKKRGRPANYKEKDLGTPELIQKRRENKTCEPLDLCLKYNLIDIEYHQAGMRLRWLRTLRLGIANIQAHDCFNLGGIYPARYTDQKMLKEMAAHYAESIRELEKICAHTVVMNICIHNILPKFLSRPALADRALELKILRKGLNRLAYLYGYIRKDQLKSCTAVKKSTFLDVWSKI